MEATRARYEEFGAAPWAGVVMAVLLIIVLQATFLHTGPTAHSPLPAIHVQLYAAR